MELFGVDIAQIIADSIGPGVLDAVLIKRTSGARTPGQLTGGTNPTTVSYPCKGFIDKQDRRNRDGELIHDGNVTILLIGKTIDNGNTAPIMDDQVTIEGVTYLVTQVDRDPAAATYSLLCPKR